jgi:hypothetical protein
MESEVMPMSRAEKRFVVVLLAISGIPIKRRALLSRRAKIKFAKIVMATTVNGLGKLIIKAVLSVIVRQDMSGTLLKPLAYRSQVAQRFRVIAPLRISANVGMAIRQMEIYANRIIPIAKIRKDLVQPTMLARILASVKVDIFTVVVDV